MNNMLNFIAELGMLKRVKRTGWWVLGIPHEESVADHSFRCAVIGYILAKMEKVNSYKIFIMTLLNDLHEARITDMHKVAHRYLDVKNGEKKAFFEQIQTLDKNIKKEIETVKKEYDKQESIESLISRDADILECLIQAKEYVDMGYKDAKKFFKNGEQHLKTKSAKQLWESAKKWKSNVWWEKLGKFER